MKSLDQEIHLKVMRQIQAQPDITQRELASILGVSLGKVNYCVKALVDRGFVKVSNFKNSNNKLAYSYLLTPSGIEQKAAITMRFLKRKVVEYEQLKFEIDKLRIEVSSSQSDHSHSSTSKGQNQ